MIGLRHSQYYSTARVGGVVGRGGGCFATAAAQVVIHGDLNAEHLLMAERNGRWDVSVLIDFGDSRIGVPSYEWMPLWLGLCNRDIAVFRAFLDAYDPRLLADEALGRRVAAWTLLHDFGTDAVAELFDTSGAIRPARSLEALQALVWPELWPPGAWPHAAPTGVASPTPAPCPPATGSPPS